MLSFHNRCRQVDRLLAASKNLELEVIMHGILCPRNLALQQNRRNAQFFRCSGKKASQHLDYKQEFFIIFL
jgi:hypothetical protein